MRLRLKDIDESAFLGCSGVFEMSGAEVDDTGRRRVVYFLMDAVDAAAGEALHKLFRSGKALIEPRVYALKQLELRRMVRECLAASPGPINGDA
jgi:hypothetical protein